MANDYYHRHNLYHQSVYLLILFILFIQTPTLVNAQSNQFIPIDTSGSRTTVAVTTTTTTTVFPILNTNNDHSYDNGNGNNLENTYDDEEEDEEAEEEVEDDEHNFSMDTSSDNISQMRVNNSIMSNVNDEGQFIEYDDEINSYQEDEEDGNIDAYADPISDNRPATKYPMINVNTKNYLDAQPTTPMPFGSSKFIRILFSKPAILVGIIGGISIGMLSAIVLVMFIIYRMRKKDEGSYALEEAPRKSPSHAYSRVSSKEFYA